MRFLYLIIAAMFWFAGGVYFGAAAHTNQTEWTVFYVVYFALIALAFRKD